MMNKLRLLTTGVSAAALLLAFAQSALADPRDFQLNNNSAVDVAQLYVSPSATDDWGDDILGSQVLPAGQFASVNFARFDGATCNFDLKVVTVSGGESYLYKVDLCSVSNVNYS